MSSIRRFRRVARVARPARPARPARYPAVSSHAWGLVLTVLIAALVISTLGGCSRLAFRRPPAQPVPAAKALNIKSTFPLPGMTEVPVSSGLVVAFETAIDLASLPKGAAFSPETTGAWEPYGAKDRLLFKAEPAWQPLTTYTLTLAGVRGEDGSTLAEPFKLTFRTGPSSLPGIGWPTSDLPAPGWSPDGRHLAFLSPPDPDVGSGGAPSYPSEAYALNLATLGRRAPTRLTNFAQRWQSPVWTPNGRSVIYAAVVPRAVTGKYNPDEVWTVQALSAGGAGGAGGAPAAQPAATALIRAADYVSPSWLAAHPSPDGRFYAVVGNYGGVDAHSDVIQNLFVADASGRKLRAVGSTGGTKHFLGWTGPDRFLFLETYDQKNHSHYFAYDLREADATTGEARTLITGGPVVGFAGGGASDDGSLVALTTWKAYDTGNSIAHLPADLVVIRRDANSPGGYSVKKVELPGAAAWAAPSPDAAEVVFACDDKGHWDLWLLDVASMATSRLTSGPDDAIAPAWSPDGRLIAFARRSKGGTELKLVRPDTKEVTAPGDVESGG